MRLFMEIGSNRYYLIHFWIYYVKPFINKLLMGPNVKNIPVTKKPNPQGKGLVAVLDELDSRRTYECSGSAVSLSQILHDYAISRLILCAQFNFKPVTNTHYYLYVKNQTLRLSLIAPREWRDDRFGYYICRCLLEESMFWRVSDKNQHPDTAEHLASAITPLKHTLLSDFNADVPLETALPYYDERLPFHRRVMANALAVQVRDRIPEALPRSFKALGKQYGGGVGKIPLLHESFDADGKVVS